MDEPKNSASKLILIFLGLSAMVAGIVTAVVLLWPSSGTTPPNTTPPTSFAMGSININQENDMSVMFSYDSEQEVMTPVSDDEEIDTVNFYYANNDGVNEKILIPNSEIAYFTPPEDGDIPQEGVHALIDLDSLIPSSEGLIEIVVRVNYLVGFQEIMTGVVTTSGIPIGPIPPVALTANADGINYDATFTLNDLPGWDIGSEGIYFVHSVNWGTVTKTNIISSPGMPNQGDAIPTDTLVWTIDGTQFPALADPVNDAYYIWTYISIQPISPLVAWEFYGNETNFETIVSTVIETDTII